MENLAKILKLTQEIVDCLQQVHGDAVERGKLIEQIQQLIEKREELLKLVKGPYTETEKKIGEKIISLNEIISKEMGELFQEIKLEMKEIQQRKAQNYSYLRPYGKIRSTDGMYLDSKL